MKYEYTMVGTELESSEWEKDLGVLVHHSLRPTMQCAKAAKKANSVLGQLLRGVGQEGVPRPPQNLCETTSGVLCPSMEPMDTRR